MKTISDYSHNIVWHVPGLSSIEKPLKSMKMPYLKEAEVMINIPKDCSQLLIN